MTTGCRKLTDQQKRLVHSELLEWARRDFAGLWAAVKPHLEYRAVPIPGQFEAWIVDDDGDNDLMVSFSLDSHPSWLSWWTAAKLVGMSVKPEHIEFHKTLVPRKKVQSASQVQSAIRKVS